jgi:cytochrome b-561 domain-containing protein 2
MSIRGSKARDKQLRLVARVVAAFVSISFVAAFFRPSVLFSWHPAYMAIGYLLLMTEGLLRAAEFRPLEKLPRVHAIQRHGWVQGAALLLLIMGYAAIYLNKVST